MLSNEEQVDNQTGDSIYGVTRSGRSRGSINSRVVYDGDPTTVWTTDGSIVMEQAFVWVDLGSDQSIGEIRWLVSDAVVGVTMTIEVSSDRQTWQPVTSISELTPGEWQSHQANVSARYVRFTFANPVGAPVIGYLAEVQLTA